MTSRSSFTRAATVSGFTTSPGQTRSSRLSVVAIEGALSISARNQSKLAFGLLRALIESAPSIATTDSLLDRVWPGLVVNPETVAARVKLLRDVIGDDPKHPLYILGARPRGSRSIPLLNRLPHFHPPTPHPPPSV